MAGPIRSRPVPRFTSSERSATSRFAEEVAAQEQELNLSFDYIVVCVVTGSTLGRHDRGLRRSEQSGARHRNRRLRNVRANPLAGSPDRRQHGQSRRIDSADPRRRDRHQSRLRLSRVWRALERNQRSDPARRADRGADHRSRLRGQVDAGHSSTSRAKASSPTAPGCSTCISAACRRSTVTATTTRTAELVFRSVSTSQPRPGGILSHVNLP